MKEEPVNIRSFNIIALTLLSHLYEVFPKRDNIDGSKFVVRIAYELGPDAEESEFLRYFTDAVVWLGDEGFIRYQSQSLEGNFSGVTLSLKGLTVLGYMPASLEGDTKLSIAQKTRQLIDTGFEKATTETISDLVKAMFVYAMKASISSVQ